MYKMTNMARVATLVLIGGMVGLAAEAKEADPYAVSTRTCKSVVNDDVKEEFPKAKGIDWDMSTVRESEVKGGVKLTGKGGYKGDSGKKREFDFECTFSKKQESVTAASWISSWDRRTHVIAEDDGSDSAISEMELKKECRDAVDTTVRGDFEHGVRKLELIDSTIEISERKGTYKMEGLGRFVGGGGDSRRFEFTCTYDEEDEEVTDSTWKHLGNEATLDPID